MKIKTKLTLGVGLLFFLIILLSIVGTVYIYKSKDDTENILVANYNSLEYCRNMLAALEEKTEKVFQKLETNLQKQEKNITEIGEPEVTAKIRDTFESFKLNQYDTTLESAIRKDIFRLMDMNMQAIQRKSEIAKATADKAVFVIAFTGLLCFAIAFTLLVNLPSNIANPIKELTESIQQIAAKKYSERVHFEGYSEFGQLAKSFNTMAEKLEEYNNSNTAKLMMEKKRIETLINNMKDPVIGLDENLKIIFANEEAIKISGLSPAELLNKSAQEVSARNDLIRTLIQDLIVRGQTVVQKKEPIKIYSQNKESYFEKETLHISITQTGEEKPKLVGHVIFLRNVTSYKELDFAKTNFIATVSHEFKTPISSIKMSLQLLENERIGNLNDEQKNLVGSIKDDADRLLKITSELLNMTQLESGNIQLSVLPTDPKEIISYAINATKTQAEQKKITFQTEYPDSPYKVQADKEKTAWVLTNLISNAIRYSYDNSTIYLSVQQSVNRVRILVRDTGQGIEPQYKEKIFDRYFRIPGTKKEGTGLGLSISKEFIEAQGGQILVESEFGAGSTFTLILNTAPVTL
ncbi:MAG: HAMP domain-containing protein [Cytophagales bacterium]|nr:MAG: HAMP domain-containing protein [Cytophagales bacterium]TAF59598.1 MAG: HAMP domain-containing protein [Cytophagales bacterium]